ncbi:MAG: hypothetical protein IPO22_03080 [Anaerolineales bacterium]|nr:hypothetical protein [Anaerolineales bacterium]
MSMEDILKVLVNSRQQGGSSAQGSDPMTDLIGGLLSGAQGQSHAPVAPAGYQQQQQQTQSGGGLGDMMGMLEMFMGNNQSGATQSSAASDPIMMLLQPYVAKLAKKVNIPPEIAMVVVSFVAHKLLSHHPTSGRDSNSFNLDDMIGQMSSGKVDKSIYETSGMVKEISKSTGLDEAAASKTLDAAFGLFGKQITTAAAPVAAKPNVTTGAKGLRSTGMKSGVKPKRTAG